MARSLAYNSFYQSRKEILGVFQLFSKDRITLEVIEVAGRVDKGLAESVDLVGGSGSTSSPLDRGSGCQMVKCDGLKSQKCLV